MAECQRELALGQLMVNIKCSSHCTIASSDLFDYMIKLTKLVLSKYLSLDYWAYASEDQTHF